MTVRVATLQRVWVATIVALGTGCTTTPEIMHPDASWLTRDSGIDAALPDAAMPLPDHDRCGTPGSTIGRHCLSAGDCDDGCFCNGGETCTGGACAAGTMPCADDVACTTDACLEEADRCVHVPDHTVCSDHHACNGYELCDLARGCVSVAPLACNDDSTCTLDSCDDAIGCVFTGRDLDGDGFVTSTCGGDDCNDYDAMVLPGAPEICDNHQDDDCNGLRDYADPACVPTNDACAEASFLALGPTGGIFSGSTMGLASDFTPSCGTPSADAVFRFTIAEPHDVRVSVEGRSGAVTILLRDYALCTSGPDLRCAATSEDTLGQHALDAGTYAVIVTTALPGSFDLRITLGPPTAAPAVDRCDASTVDVSAGGTFTGSFEDARNDYALSCDPSTRADAAYRFVIPPGDARDVVVTASVAGGASNAAFVALTTDCSAAGNELACVRASSSALMHRALGPGTYFLLLEPSDPGATSWSMTVTFTDPPAPRNLGDACSSAFELTPTGSATTSMGSVLLSSLEPDAGASCGPTSGGNDAYFHFVLTASHDVTITTSTGGTHATSLETTCGDTTSELRCRSGSSPLTQTFHQLPIGDYWVVTETASTTGTLTASLTLAPPTAPPANDVCASAIALAVPIDVRMRDSLVGFADDLRGGACAPTGLVDAFYTFTLGTPMSVSLDASTVPTSASDLWLTLRASCGAGVDLACGTGAGSVHVGTATQLAAGTYTVFVEMRESEAADFRLQFAAFP